MILTINGTDIVPYIAFGGIKWQRSDVDGEGAGRTLDGNMRRNRVATKIRLDITCRPLTAKEAAIVLSLIMPEWVTVVYTDPQAGATLSTQMYANNNTATYAILRRDGTECWSGITFPLIAR